VYDFSYQLLIAKFALSVVISLCIFLFLLRPFLAGLRNEARRVAELLCQLPSDIAVEDMVGRAMGLMPPSSLVASAAHKDAPNVVATVAKSGTFAHGSVTGSVTMGKELSSYKF
jgi:hypothetical protein